MNYINYSEEEEEEEEQQQQQQQQQQQFLPILEQATKSVGLYVNSDKKKCSCLFIEMVPFPHEMASH